MTAHIYPGVPKGLATAPPSKSMAHRLLACAALCEGVSTIDNIAKSDDVLATVGALRQLGAEISMQAGQAQVRGTGGHFTPCKSAVQCASSASTLRLLLPLFSFSGAAVLFSGSSQLLARPMGVYQQLFEQHGLRFEHTAQQLAIAGALPAGHYRVPGNVSSQFISGLLLALPLHKESSSIEVLPPFESSAYVEMTRGAQQLFGVQSHWQGNVLHIPGGQRYRAGHLAVEGDWSQGAALLVLGALNGDVAVQGLPRETLQPDAAILPILQACGCAVGWDGALLKATALCHPLHTPAALSLSPCPDLGPLLCVLGLFCNEPLRLTHAGRLRLKESNRAAAMAAELGKLDAEVQLEGDEITVAPGCFALSGQRVQAHEDHRVAMALAVAAVAAAVEMEIEGAEAVQKSWPEFWDTLAGLGMDIVTA